MGSAVRARVRVRVSPSLLPPSYHQVGSAEERALLLAGLTITRNVEFSQVERIVVGLAVPFPFPPYPSSCTPHP